MVVTVSVWALTDSARFLTANPTVPQLSMRRMSHCYLLSFKFKVAIFFCTTDTEKEF